MPSKVKPKPGRKARPSDTVTGAIRAIIGARGLTAYSVAASAGLAPSVVSRFMAEERTLSGESLDLVCAALGLKLVEARRGRAGGVAKKGAGVEPANDTSNPEP